MSWIEQMERVNERYMTSDIHGAFAALVEGEALLRRPNLRIPQRDFALAVFIAKRSEIACALGDSDGARALLEEALVLFRSEPLGLRAGLTEPEAVQAFIRHQEQVGVRWRQLPSPHA